jgi:hypothetical protein
LLFPHRERGRASVSDLHAYTPRYTVLYIIYYYTYRERGREGRVANFGGDLSL